MGKMKFGSSNASKDPDIDVQRSIKAVDMDEVATVMCNCPDLSTDVKELYDYVNRKSEELEDISSSAYDMGTLSLERHKDLSQYVDNMRLSVNQRSEDRSLRLENSINKELQELKTSLKKYKFYGTVVLGSLILISLVSIMI